LIETAIFCCVTFLKPWATTVTVYVPGAILGIVKFPALFVTDSYNVDVATFVADTFAFSTVAPVESETVPSNVPLTACPYEILTHANNNVHTKSNMRFVIL
jgi:hypothetical protein